MKKYEANAKRRKGEKLNENLERAFQEGVPLFLCLSMVILFYTFI